MAATLVEVVRHILRDTLHATSIRSELSEVGELLEDVVADFGASIRLRDSAGIAEGRDALMEAVNILDEIVMNYDAAHDEFTMDPATLQDELLRLAQQLQIVVPAHNNLLGDIRGELPSQRPSSNAQELYEGYGDELGLMQQIGGQRGEHHIQRPQTWTDLISQIRGELNNMPLQCRHACVHQLLCRLHRPGPDPAGDTEEGHRCALQLLSVLEREFPGSYHSNGQCEADAIWLLLRGERLAEYIDGMNLPAEERVRGGQEDEHPGLRGLYQHHERNAREAARGQRNTHDQNADRSRTEHPDDFEPTALMQTSLRGRTTQEGHPPSSAGDTTCTSTSTTTTPQQRDNPLDNDAPRTPRRSRSPSTRGPNRTAATRGEEQQTPSPIHRARSQASQLMASIASETQAAAEYAPNEEELGGRQREAAAAEALDLITEAMGVANDVGMPGVVDYLSAAATRLSQVHLVRRPGTNRGGRPLPTPNAFEIAALTVGIMEESAQQGEPPSMAELLELLELVQAGMALLTRGRHSYNWQVTHWATDAAEEALALLAVATATDHVGELQRTQPEVGDTLPRLHEAATGVGVLVGIYPHRGEAEQVHPADAIAQQEGRHHLEQHSHRDPPEAIHVYKAQRLLRQLVPFLHGDMREMGSKALAHLGDWIQSHWGEAVQLLSSEDETSPPHRDRHVQPTANEDGGEPNSEGVPYKHEGAAATIMDPISGAASSTTPFTRSAAPGTEGEASSEPNSRRRRGFTSPSSLDNDD